VISRTVRSVAAAAALVVASTVMTLGVVEAALRLAMPVGYFIWKPHTSRTFKPAPEVMPGVSGVSQFRTNSQGLRADEPVEADAYRVLTLGGSTTECLYLDQSEAWPQLLQDKLGAAGYRLPVWVGNGGMSGRNSRHHVLAMRHLPLKQMRIDSVVVLAGINDLSIRLSQADAYDPDALIKPAQEERLRAETFLGLHRADPSAAWYRRTVLWQMARSLKARLVESPVARGAQDDAGTVYEQWRRHRQLAGRWLRELPDLRTGLAEYERNLREIAGIARANSVRLVFMTQPTLWHASMPPDSDRLLWFGGVGDFQVRRGQPYYTAEALAEGMRQYNDVMLRICESEKLECIDLGSLPKDTSVFYDDVHFNEAGSRRVADIVSAHFATRPPFAHR
jgi:lysophospholipase L1-like esterase